MAVFDADTRIKPDFVEKIAPYLRDYDGVQARITTSNTNRFMPSIIDLEWVCYTDLSESFGTKNWCIWLIRWYRTDRQTRMPGEMWDTGMKKCWWKIMTYP